MTIIVVIFAAILLVVSFIALALMIKRLEKTVIQRDGEIAEVKQESERLRHHCESETLRVRTEAQDSVAKAQVLLDQERQALLQEAERLRQHYETEARRVLVEANTEITNTRQSMESLRKYETMRDAEAEVQRVLAVATNEAIELRKEAQALVEQARIAAVDERSQARQKALLLRDQAEALLAQATRDAGCIIAEAEKRAEQTGGDAYRALREKEQLEEQAKAIRNVVDGYGDRYLIPTHSLLDDLAAEFGYAAAGETLKSARNLSRLMVEQGEAASCEYVESNRRTTAIQFVIHAFNGRVDAILSRIKHDNYGTLEQEIRDAFSLVNKDGKAFREARILPAYLDARLAELKWGVVVQGLALKQREEQRALQEQMRDEEKARREIEKQIRDTANQEEMLKAAMAKAQQAVQQASEEQKAKFEQELNELSAKLKQAEEKSQRALSMAQQTKQGHIYIISNVGAFGENVYKIGQTRRIVPEDRVDELSNASVPFEFDIHGMIKCENAPGLEDALHKRFAATRWNKWNMRKEFFRVSLSEIRQEIDKLVQGKGVTLKTWTEKATATEWNETQHIESTPENLQKWLRSEKAKSRRPLDFGEAQF